MSKTGKRQPLLRLVLLIRLPAVSLPGTQLGFPSRPVLPKDEIIIIFSSKCLHNGKNILHLEKNCGFIARLGGFVLHAMNGS